jgi:lysophospholipase L1-like esterase
MKKAYPDWTVLNRGVNGQRSDEILARFESDVLSESPYCVIILAGVNDVYQGAPLEFTKKNLLAMYEKAIASKITVIAATVLPYNTASSREAGAIRDLNNWIANTANGLGILFCDTNLAVRDPHNRDRLLSTPDGLHPDVSGYCKMGRVLAETIARKAKTE